MTRNATVEDLPLLERRRIEAGVLVPVIRALQAEFGEEAVNRVVGAAIREIARAQGEARAKQAHIESMADLQRVMSAGPISEGSLIVDVVEQDEAHYGFNVTTCKFVEMYEAMGARDLGFLLSCGRDYAAFAGMAPGFEFNRTQTRMEGATHCDFRYKAPAGDPPVTSA
ncbi:MAG: L-2-amino-thiazoline-4-carboxylic acid hydrolase [Chloroflexi bacterium]|nr:L-2-amino-thiazoline-4-carboxylic acid hydrolase [Chloroflexota bacterium]